MEASEWAKQHVHADGTVEWVPLKGSALKDTRASFKAFMAARFRDDADPDELDNPAPTHLLIGAGRSDHTGIRVVGSIRDLHGPTGVCTCCARSSKKAVA